MRAARCISQVYLRFCPEVFSTVLDKPICVILLVYFIFLLFLFTYLFIYYCQAHSECSNVILHCFKQFTVTSSSNLSVKRPLLTVHQRKQTARHSKFSGRNGIIKCHICLIKTVLMIFTFISPVNVFVITKKKKNVFGE